MNIVKIPKKTKGQFREIAIPSEEEKSLFRSFLPNLNNQANKLCGPHVHGFMQNKSPVTNAKAHINFRYSLSFDLSDFFDTVKDTHLKGKLDVETITKLMPEGRAYQGLPTSPALANIAAVDMDKAILKKIKGLGIVFTRYADDLTFSFDDFSLVVFLKSEVPQTVSRCGFKINKLKTRLQDSRFGRRVITGISVEEDIRPTRKLKRKIRAAAFQKNENSLAGLNEWAKLKEPCKNERPYSQGQIDELTKLWNLPKIILKDLPKKEESTLKEDIIITGDLPYTLGISTFTTNWTSCTRQGAGAGSSAKRTVGWAYLQGTRVAALLSNETLKFASIERRKMRARTLVHTFVDNSMWHDRVYGEDDKAVEELKRELNSHNIFYVGKSTPDKGKVKGAIPLLKCKVGPYLDSLKAVNMVSTKFGSKTITCITFK